VAEESPKLIVGLGNPGKEYERTRHNAGFMVLDEIARRWNLDSWKTKDSARQIFDSSRRVVLIEPTSFMNLSGTPVRLISSWYRTPPEDVLVVVDEMDLPFGDLRMRPFGGHGGHNGLRSIIATIGDRFPRIRFGVGRPEYDTIDHVLSPFTKDESKLVPTVVDAAADGAILWLERGLEAAMQFTNNWKITDTKE
jgi:peptidyl-tRNA hydrolase, PTH1 family